MDQWYAYIAGRQYGPVPFETLRQWVDEGRVTFADLVWSPGMPQWKPAGGLEGLAARAISDAPVLRPHRAVAVLVLGIVSLVFCVFLGVIPWVMGNRDLREMDAGRMNPAGRGLTQAGRVCGIVSVIIDIALVLMWLVAFGVWSAAPFNC